MEQITSDQDPSDLYRQLDSYDWENDKEFNSGLNTILTSAPSDQAPRLALRARCYYFARKFGKSVDFQGYLNWSNLQSNGINGQTQLPEEQPSVNAQQSASQSSGPMGNAPPPASFAEICELIAAGKPIPGIKDIPDTVLEGQATQSQASARKKPWEKDATPAPPPAWARST